MAADSATPSARQGWKRELTLRTAAALIARAVWEGLKQLASEVSDHGS